MAGEVSAFISYSRSDTDFVDRLEADLRAHGVVTWVDRRRLEVGRDWQQQLDSAVANNEVMIVVLSPEALMPTSYVRDEYEYAYQLGRRIVPVLYKECDKIPLILRRKQYADFTDPKTYVRMVKELIYACQDDSIDLTADDTTLHGQAIAFEANNNLERAAVFYQRLLDRDPNFANGQVQRDLDRLNRQLYPRRALSLRKQAEDTRKLGAYGAEVQALKAIIALGNYDSAMLKWAKEYLEVAEKNYAQLGLYQFILKSAAEGKLTVANEKLSELWKKAPFFRDPGGIAPALGRIVPPTYEEDKALRLAEENKAKQLRLADEERTKQRQLADDQKRQRETSAAASREDAIARTDADMQAQVKQAQDKWQQACAFMQGDLSATSAEEVTRRLKSLDALPGGSAALEYIQDLTQTWCNRQSASPEVDTAVSELQQLTPGIGPYDTAGNRTPWRYLLLIVPLVLCSLAALGSFALEVLTLLITLLGVLIGATRDGQPPLIQVFAETIITGIIVLILVRLTIFVNKLPRTRAERELEHAQQMVDRHRQVADGYIKETQRLYQEWLRDAESLHQERMRQVKDQRQRKITDAKNRCQSQLSESTAEHARMQADSYSRYQKRKAEIDSEYRRAISAISAQYRN